MYRYVRQHPFDFIEICFRTLLVIFGLYIALVDFFFQDLSAAPLLKGVKSLDSIILLTLSLVVGATILDRVRQFLKVETALENIQTVLHPIMQSMSTVEIAVQQIQSTKVSNIGQLANNILDITANWGVLRIFLDEITFLKSYMIKDISATLLMSCLGAYYNNDLKSYKRVIDLLQSNYYSNNDLERPLRVCGHLAGYYRELWDTPRGHVPRERMELARLFEKEANETDSAVIKAICLNYVGLIWRHHARTLKKGVPSEESWQKSIDAFSKALVELDRTRISEFDGEIWRAFLHRNLGRSFLSLSRSAEGKKNLWSSLRAWEAILGSVPAMEGVTYIAVYSELSFVRLDLLKIGEPISEEAVWLNETEAIIEYGDEFFPALRSLRAAYKQHRRKRSV